MITKLIGIATLFAASSALPAAPAPTLSAREVAPEGQTVLTASVEGLCGGRRCAGVPRCGGRRCAGIPRCGRRCAGVPRCGRRCATQPRCGWGH
ncbi:hypothetical protein [Mesoterricola silvestris]|uniref:Uncharacterized protein n=1 Tax=Mesoterricola silvestris TaxID=2927979 RepID=A0AA48GP80_9BACT|nr:hypothetical protein [Mesoterricola silvestris]BDU71625.1 hypothetical protein METEAL_07990 [Mesoterricola silvestris]